MALFYAFAFRSVAERLEGGQPQGGVVPLIPGVTIPLEDLAYVALALGVGVALHEAAHAVMARVEGVRVKDFGVALLLFIPAAFVEIDENDMGRAPLSSKLKIFSAGIAANIAIALLALAAFQALGPSLYSGVSIISVEEGSPADMAGLEPGMTIVAVNGVEVRTIGDLSRLLEEAGVRDPEREAVVTITVVTGEGGVVKDVTVVKPRGRESIGVVVVNKPSSPLTPILQSLFVLNLGIAAINAAPLALPLPGLPVMTDGAQMLAASLERLLGSAGRILGATISLATLLIVLSMITLTPITFTP
jgi:membrane-associated protease RseP (regulator of RpoE activity)